MSNILINSKGFIKAIFIGIKNSDKITREDVLSEDSNIYQFEVNGEVKDYCIKNKGNDYYIQNHLIPTYEYLINIEDNKIREISFYDIESIKGNIVGFIPGERTIKNLLCVAVAPLGKTIYVFGGGWSFQDDKASFLSRSIGVAPIWKSFYDITDENYSYKNDTYPKNNWNQYYYAGLDCSGYIGWIVYNTMYTESEKEEGFVCSSTQMAKTFAEKYHFGIWQHPNTEDYKEISRMLYPGDIVSIDGHVYIVIGRCSDDSIVIIHSTVTKSVTGIDGGGVQLSAISVDGDNDTSCEAYILAKKYMEKYYPEWVKKYPVVVKPVSVYFSFGENKDVTGIFSWNIDDYDKIKNMTANEVLKIIFDD